MFAFPYFSLFFIHFSNYTNKTYLFYLKQDNAAPGDKGWGRVNSECVYYHIISFIHPLYTFITFMYTYIHPLYMYVHHIYT